MAPMAAFLTSWKMAIRHKFFIDHYLYQIFTCYKMAMWPLIARHFETLKMSKNRKRNSHKKAQKPQKRKPRKPHLVRVFAYSAGKRLADSGDSFSSLQAPRTRRASNEKTDLFAFFVPLLFCLFLHS
jgi:hypothetical protein